TGGCSKQGGAYPTTIAEPSTTGSPPRAASGSAKKRKAGIGWLPRLLRRLGPDHRRANHVLPSAIALSWTFETFGSRKRDGRRDPLSSADSHRRPRQVRRS